MATKAITLLESGSFHRAPQDLLMVLHFNQINLLYDEKSLEKSCRSKGENYSWIGTDI